MRILVTGACGRTAESIVTALAAADHEVCGFDLPTAPCRRAKERMTRLYRGTVTELDDIERAIESSDAVVHLAIATGRRDYRSGVVPFATNVLGTYNVFEAARRLQVARVVLLSEAAVHLPPTEHSHDAVEDWRSTPGSDHLYDLTKRLQEQIARDYAETFGLQVIVLRAGHVVDGRLNTDLNGTSLVEVSYCRDGWVCRYDLADACLKAVAFEQPGYSVFHVVGSLAARERFDVARTERELGVIFVHRFEQYESTQQP